MFSRKILKNTLRVFGASGLFMASLLPYAGYRVASSFEEELRQVYENIESEVRVFYNPVYVDQKRPVIDDVISGEEFVRLLEPEGDISEALIRHTSVAMGDAEQTLSENSVDILRESTDLDIEQMVAEVKPFIAYELGLDRLNSPRVKLVDEITESRIFMSGNGGQAYLDVIFLPRSSISSSKSIAAHEYIHVQWLLMNLVDMIPHLFSNMVSLLQLGKFDGSPGPLKETYVEVLSWEVLADQALSGDDLARYSFFDEFNDSLRRMEMSESSSSITILDDQLYKIKPARIVMEAISGERTHYAGIELDGVIALVRGTISDKIGKNEDRALSYQNLYRDSFFVTGGQKN
jgi:hypothetical protein